MNIFLNYFYKEKKIYIINILLISFLPLTLITRSVIINLVTFLIPLFFLITIFNEKKIFFFKDKIFYLLLFFWLTLIVNIIASSDPLNSLPRVLALSKFILLAFSIKYYLIYKNYKYEKLIYKIWFLTFIVVSLDLLFEFTFGFNTVGFESNFPGRLAGFLNQELKIGHYYYAFFLISIAYVHSLKKNYYFLGLLSLFFVFISFAIGERSNFIKAFIIFLAFYLIYQIIYHNKNFLKKIFILLIFSSVLIFIGFKNDGIKLRTWDQFLKPIYNNTKVFDYIINSHYGAHYDTAIQIFKKYPIFGVGLKNYRNESSKDIYKSGNNKVDQKRWATHPHQVHFEILSETGIFGYLSFLLVFIISIYTSIKCFLKNYNLYQLSSILVVCVSLLPILPSGSFFTTYSATIFWINFAIMTAYNNKKVIF